MGQRAFSSASTRSMGSVVLPIPSRTYATDFPGTENPLSQGSNWISGGTTGGLWRDVQCTPGLAFGTGPSASPPYDDPTAVLAGDWPIVQTAQARVVINALDGVNQEVELRLLTRVTPKRIVGYEFLFSITNNPYVQIMRWDGGTDISFFTSVAFGAGPQLQTGYRIRATVSASGLLSSFVDTGSGFGAAIISGTDTTYREGSPGIGFFQHAGTAGPLSGFGLSSFAAWASAT